MAARRAPLRPNGHSQRAPPDLSRGLRHSSQAAPNDQLSERLHVAWELASLLRRKRFEQGSLDLDFPEVKVRLDEQGKPILLERIENDESHQLVEEFMLAANEAVARELKNRSIPTIYRVHENPEPDKLAEYRELVLSYNYKAGDLTQSRGTAAAARFASRQTGGTSAQDRTSEKSEARALRGAAARPLRSRENQLHSFHQPDSRYADLVVHRALAERDQCPSLARATWGRWPRIAEHISITERVAAEAEMDR